jgi:hypothetical protein
MSTVIKSEAGKLSQPAGDPALIEHPSSGSASSGRVMDGMHRIAKALLQGANNDQRRSVRA